MNRNKKALGIMLGTLVFLLVLAVVLLSVIIVSLAKDEDEPVITTPEGITQSTVPVQSTDKPSTSGSQPSSNIPQTSDKPAITSGTERDPATEPGSTSDNDVQTTKPEESKPPVVGPNIPLEDIETVKNSDGSIVRSGAFRDNGDAKIHLVIKWEAKYASEDATTATLTVQVYLQSYSIKIASRDNNTLSINGNSTVFKTEGIYYSNNDMHLTPLTVRTVTITKDSAAYNTEVELDATWNCKGTYSGVQIDWLMVAGTIEV